MASYPGAVVNFSTKHNLTDVVDAADPNNIQAEVVALETAVGINPATGVTQVGASYLSSNRTFSSLSARVANLEHGLVADTHTQYVKISGGSTVAPGSGTVGLTVQANGADGLRVKDTAGNIKIYTDTNGNLFINGSEVPVTQSQAGGSVSTQAAGDAAAPGSSTDYSRKDHKHAMPAGDGPAGTATFRSLGTGAQQAAAGTHGHTSLDLTTFTEASSALTASGATTTVDCSLGSTRPITLQTNTTIAFSNVPASGKCFSTTLVFIQDATGGRTITWPASVKWSNGVQPTQNTTANSVNIYSLFTYDGGTTWYAFLSGKGMA